MGGFTLDSTDLANLIRLGNASRRVKGVAMIGFVETDVVANAAGGVNRGWPWFSWLPDRRWWLLHQHQHLHRSVQRIHC